MPSSRTVTGDILLFALSALVGLALQKKASWDEAMEGLKTLKNRYGENSIQDALGRLYKDLGDQNVDDWARKLYLAKRNLAPKEEYYKAMSLNDDRKAVLNLLYEVVKLWNKVRDELGDWTAGKFEDKLVDIFEVKRIKKILDVALPMDRAHSLYAMLDKLGKSYGLHWCCKYHFDHSSPHCNYDYSQNMTEAERENWRKLLGSNYLGRPTMNKNLFQLLFSEKIGLVRDFPDRYGCWSKPQAADFVSIGTFIKSDNYKLLRVIGQGAFGTVHLARKEDTREDVAVKIVPFVSSDCKMVNMINEEIELMRRSRSPFIVEYMASFVTKYGETSKMWIVMEYCGGGSLASPIRRYVRFSEGCIKFVSASVTSALVSLHTLQKICHRDVKSLNILITTDGDIKIADFGVSANLAAQTKRNTCIGTPDWMAPEVKARQPYDGKADVYSLGITLRDELATSGRTETGAAWSRDMDDFLGCCLKEDPSKRSDSSSLSNHTFIKDEILELRRFHESGDEGQLSESMQNARQFFVDLVNEEQNLAQQNIAFVGWFQDQAAGDSLVPVPHEVPSNL